MKSFLIVAVMITVYSLIGFEVKEEEDQLTRVYIENVCAGAWFDYKGLGVDCDD